MTLKELIEERENPPSRRDSVTPQEYARIHYWLKSKYGKSDTCESPTCLGRSKTFEWALRRGFEYSFNRDAFWKLCKSCHALYDLTEDGRRRISIGAKESPNNPSVTCTCGIVIEKPRNKQKFCEACRKLTQDEHKRNWILRRPDWKKQYYLDHIEEYHARYKRNYEKRQANLKALREEKV